jgi:hypothetical protein
MSVRPWWEIFPGRREHELKALAEAGYQCIIDNEAERQGFLHLHITEPKLVVLFPDLYPYFRFEIRAPGLNLPHHQNPFTKNLCLIGRSTHFWNTTDTVAAFLKEQLPKTINAGQSSSLPEVKDVEQHQAEPVSDFYTYLQGASIIVDNIANYDTSLKTGIFTIGTNRSDTPLINGALLEVYDENLTLLSKANEQLFQLYSKHKITGRWVRLPAFPETNIPRSVFDKMQSCDHVKTPQSYALSIGRITIRAGLIPEELKNWRTIECGWIFSCLFEPNKLWLNQKIN